MDYLSKQQLVLLALLVSFMTSLATGIVTVSLMDQAPAGVTRTVSQVIEKTIQQVAPQSAAVGTVAIQVDDQLANTVSGISPSIVRIQDTRSNAIVGLGIVVSKDGAVMTDKSIVPQFSGYSAIFSDGTIVPLSTVPPSQVFSQTSGDIALLAPLSPLAGSVAPVYEPISAASSFGLGQAAYSISGTSTSVLGQGDITETSASSSPIITSIPVGKTALGSPLFDIRGHVIGIRTASMPTDGGSSFYPIAPLISAIQVVK